MSVLEDAKQFGRTVGAARGSMPHPQNKKKHFAQLLGTSLPTLTRLEEGAVGTLGNIQKRRQWAELVIEKSGCPREWFGLSAPAEEPGGVSLTARVEALEQVLVQLRSLALAGGPEEERELREQLERGAAFAPPREPRSGHPEDQRNEGQNG